MNINCPARVSPAGGTTLGSFPNAVGNRRPEYHEIHNVRKVRPGNLKYYPRLHEKHWLRQMAERSRKRSMIMPQQSKQSWVHPTFLPTRDEDTEYRWRLTEGRLATILDAASNLRAPDIEKIFRYVWNSTSTKRRLSMPTMYMYKGK